jgi:deoxyribodipyrimidine photo-lyase
MDETAPERGLKAPATVPPLPDGVESDRLETWELHPAKPDWATSIAAAWTPGETGARARLDMLVTDILREYERTRVLPGHDGTSRLSPHLHFGEISPRDVWCAVMDAASAKGGKLDADAKSFLHALLWREFSHHQLFHRPGLAISPFKSDFAKMLWRDDPADLAAWCQARTGYPIIDAGLRELYATGWMHHSVRMITASFLVKHLLIPWQKGADWFADTLVDADLASNCANWQQVAGCGANAPAFTRILNPILQGKKIDPDASYVKAWVPELSKLPKRRIHEPWKASKAELEKARFSLGETYPERIVDLGEGRKRALAAYEKIRVTDRQR